MVLYPKSEKTYFKFMREFEDEYHNNYFLEVEEGELSIKVMLTKQGDYIIMYDLQGNIDTLKMYFEDLDLHVSSDKDEAIRDFLDKVQMYLNL